MIYLEDCVSLLSAYPNTYCVNMKNANYIENIVWLLTLNKEVEVHHWDNILQKKIIKCYAAWMSLAVLQTINKFNLENYKLFLK